MNKRKHFSGLSVKEKKELWNEIFHKRGFWEKLYDWIYYTICYNWPAMASWKRD